MRRLFLIVLSLFLSGLVSAQTWNVGTPNAEDVKATLSNDTLYIRGVGAMRNFTNGGSPWYSSINSNVRNVIIDDGITVLGNYVFQSCKFTKIDIPESVYRIGNYAFNLAWDIDTLYIPKSVTIIGDCAFRQNGMKHFIVDDDNPNFCAVDGVLYDKTKTTIVKFPCRKAGVFIIPNTVTTIESDAFQISFYLTEVIIPNVTNIPTWAFYSCSSLIRVTFGKNVVTIGDYAFPNNPSISFVTNLNPTPQVINSGVFQYLPKTLCVPCGSLEDYQNAPVWKDFGTIIEMDCPKTGISNTKVNFSCPGQVTVTYDLNTTQPTDVTLYYSHNKRDWLPAVTVTGQTSGASKTIIWDNYADNVRFGKFYFKVEVPQVLEPECVWINGVCWATRNVDKPGTFAANPEDFGMYYQWNRTQDWIGIDNPVGFESSIPTGTTWEMDNNICPSGYRIPTDVELRNLVNAGSQWTFKNDVRGVLFGSGDNSIFMPAAGHIEFNSGKPYYFYAGVYGQYWSSQASGTNNAMYLYFNNGNSPGVNSHPRNMAKSVRCVAESSEP